MPLFDEERFVSTQPHVFVGLPSRPGDQIAAGLLTATHNMGGGFSSQLQARPCSLLTTNFNLLWCEALNARPRVTHFVMCHSDVIPDVGWVETLLKEYQHTGADILSCCIPLKDDRGLTSTGVMNWETRKMRKFSVAETLRFPRSFTASDVGFPGHALLMNTGLWICAINNRWAEKMVFRQKDAIVQQADGKFRPVSVSEDWLFSIDAARLGLRCLATTAVKIVHQGGFAYPNFTPWGTEEREDDSVAAVAWDINPPEAWGWEKEAVGCPLETAA